MLYSSMSLQELAAEKAAAEKEYQQILDEHLSLDMSRGKPGAEQLDLSEEMLGTIKSNADCFSSCGTDCRNYGIVDGIPEAKALFAEILGVSPDEVIVGGNSSLNLMYDQMVRCLLYGVNGGTGAWVHGKVKFLCPAPGYDRHFGICESLGIEMIPVSMTETGPDMNEIEALVKDPDVKGIWCVPKYSNPDGITYSDETVRRFASLRPASKDFRIFWDNAYCVHDIYDDGDELLNILTECKKAGNPNLVYIFTSTSKITYPGSGVSAMASSKDNIDFIKSKMIFQTIGHDKMNMLRHVRYFGDADGVRKYMKRHADILRPKFDVVLDCLEREIAPRGIGEWTKPKGGYFISLNVPDGCAKETVKLAKEAGITLTNAGATFPYGKDPRDRNIRIAPSFPTTSDLKKAIEVLCVCIRLVAVNMEISKR